MVLSSSTSSARALSSSSAIRMRIEPESAIAVRRWDVPKPSILSACLLSRNLLEQIRRAHGLTQREVAGRILLVAWFPSGHHADPERRALLSREGHEIPTTAVRKADVGHEHVEIKGIVIQACPRLLEAAYRVNVMPVTLEELLHELAAVHMVLHEKDAPWRTCAVLQRGTFRGIGRSSGEHQPNQRALARN